VLTQVNGGLQGFEPQIRQIVQGGGGADAMPGNDYR
jgi:hypothetical protein